MYIFKYVIWYDMMYKFIHTLWTLSFFSSLPFYHGLDMLLATRDALVINGSCQGSFTISPSSRTNSANCNAFPSTSKKEVKFVPGSFRMIPSTHVFGMCSQSHLAIAKAHLLAATEGIRSCNCWLQALAETKILKAIPLMGVSESLDWNLERDYGAGIHQQNGLQVYKLFWMIRIDNLKIKIDELDRKNLNLSEF